MEMKAGVLESDNQLPGISNLYSNLVAGVGNIERQLLGIGERDYWV